MIKNNPASCMLRDFAFTAKLQVDIYGKLTAMNLKPLLKTLSGTAGYVTPLLHVVDLRGQNSTVTALSSASGTPAIIVKKFSQ